jgi:hypothetical protein
MKLEYDKHYVNKAHTKHYYKGHIFTNLEWDELINGVRVQNMNLGNNSKYRVVPIQCERWYNTDNNTNHIVHRCPNKVFYRSNWGGYFCKFCAHEIAKFNDKAEFTKIKN